MVRVDDVPAAAQGAVRKERSIWPNAISCLRIVLAISLLPLIQSTAQHHYVAGLAIVLLAAATDGLDGYIARGLRASSELGAMLDLIADRVLVIIGIVILVVAGAANLYLCISVIVRETVADSVRAFGIAGANHEHIANNAFGRAKFCAIVVAISSGLLGLSGILPSNLAVTVANISLAGAVLLGIGSVLVIRRQLRDRQRSANRNKQSENVAARPIRS